MKKILSLLLCLAMIFGSFAAFAEGEDAAEAVETSAAAVDMVIRAPGSDKVLSASADGSGLTIADYSKNTRAQLWRIQNGTIYTRVNNRAITVDGGVVLAANKSQDNQKWTVTDEGFIAFAGGGYLVPGDEENVVISQSPYRWEVLTAAELEGAVVDNTVYPTVAIGGTMVMALDGTTNVLTIAEDNTSLTITPYAMGRNNQLWNFSKSGEAFNIIANTGNMIDVSGNSLNPGGQLILWRSTGGDNQKWMVEQEQGKCYVKSMLSGLYASADANGNITQQAKANASAWQVMSLDDMNSALLVGNGNSLTFENNRRLLENLGVVTAGSYREGDMVSNRDAVTFVVRLATGGSELGPVQSSGFADLPGDDPASGYAYSALTLGLIDPRTNFYPNSAARADDVVASLVRTLGFGEQAKLVGGYMAMASQQGLLKGVSTFENNTLTYGQLFKLLKNALSVDVYNQYGYLLSLGGRKYLDYRWNISVLKRAVVTDVNYEKKIFAATCDGEDYELDLPANYQDAELKGLQADIWLDLRTGEVINIEAYVSSSVVYGYLTAVNGVDDPDASFNPYLVNTVNVNYQRSRIDISRSTVISVNGSSNVGGDVAMVNSFVRMVVKNGKASYMDIYQVSEGGLFRSFDGKDFTFLQGERQSVRLRRIDDKDSIVVVLNGRRTSIDKLPYNALIDYCETDKLLFVAATVDIVSGIFEGTQDEYYVIGSGKYEPGSLFGKVYYSYDMGATYKEDSSYMSGYFGNQVAAYLDACGNIRYIRGEKVSDGVIGIITNAKLGLFGGIESLMVFSDYTGVMSSQVLSVKLGSQSDLTEKQLIELIRSGDTDNTLFEFYISDGKVYRIMKLDWLNCSDNAKNNVSAAVRGDLVKDYGEARIDELFANPNIFITGWTMGRDYGLTRIHFNAAAADGSDYTMIAGGFNTRYIMAYDSDENFRPREISWYDYRNTNFDKSFLKVGFLPDNEDHLYPDVVYILSSNKYVAVSSWDVHGVVSRVLERPNETYTIELLEPGGFTGEYTITESEDILGYLDGSRPGRGDIVTLTVRGNYEKVYYNIYGEAIPEEEAYELEDAGEYVEVREEYQTNGYASVAKVWDMPNEIGKFNNEYSITYVDNVYKIDGNLMYYRDSSTGAIGAYTSTGGQLFIMEDASHYLMFDYEDLKRDDFTSPITLDDISTVERSGESDKLLIFSVSRGRYPKVIVRMPQDWEP